MKRYFLVFFFVISASFALMGIEDSSVGGAAIGPNVSVNNGKALKWEEGRRDFFVLFKSLLLNNEADDDSANPQADTCASDTSKVFTLATGKIPEDAIVTDAFLVWTAGAKVEDQHIPTIDAPDNTVTLTFTNSINGAITKTLDITAPEHTYGDASEFGYEGVKMEDYLRNGLGSALSCSSDSECANSASSGFKCINGYCGTRSAFYTYRIDVTDFFEDILAQGRNNGLENDGQSFLGDYTVTGLECADGEPYIDRTVLVNNWALFLVYTSNSQTMKPKKIYFYNGFKNYNASETDITVSGFELPKDPTARITLMVSEGDPGLYNETVTQLEGLRFKGDSSLPWKSIKNSCNPVTEAKNALGMPTGTTYIEVYNSISSTYNWDADSTAAPECIGGTVSGDSIKPDKSTMEYAIDVDTFLLTPEEYPGHLNIGGSEMFLKVGANQDMVFTNMLVVSVDTKPALFDIPGEDEKTICTCSDSPSKACPDRPLYFLIKVQNWGDEIAKNVKVYDALKANYKYVSGTTEMTTRFNVGTENESTTHWTKVSDGANGEFPLSVDGGLTVAEEMIPCEDSTKSTCDTVYIRFKVDVPDDIGTWSKGEVLENQATITAGASDYRTNSDVPLVVRMDSVCPTLASCSEPSTATCGEDLGTGNVTPECTTKDDCDANKICVGGKCVEDTGAITDGTTNAIITVKSGDASPYNGSSPIAVNKSVSGLVLGQVNVKAAASSGTNFKFETLYVTIENSNFAIDSIKKLYLYKDNNSDGVVDTTDTLVDTVALTGTNAEFTINAILAKNTAYNYLVTADISYDGTISGNNTFKMVVSAPSNVIFSDSGTPTVTLSSTPLAFASYVIEPESNSLVFTKGAHDAKGGFVDSDALIPVMQIRANAKTTSTNITSISFEVEESDTSVYLGNGIDALALYIDANNNGKIDAGETQIGYSDSFEYGTEYTFNGLAVPCPADSDVYIIVAALLSVSEEMTAQIYIPNGGVTNSASLTVFKLPLYSAAFEGNAVSDDEGCSCSTVSASSSDNETLFFILSMIAFVSVFFFIRKKAA